MNTEDDHELIGGSSADAPSSNRSITRMGEMEFIFRPLPPDGSRESIQRAWMERWERVWSTFYGGDVQSYLEILKDLPYPFMSEWVKTGEAFSLVYNKKCFYEFGVYPWLKNWFALQAEPTGEPVQQFRNDARRIKIRFELAELIFNHPNHRINVGWNSSFDGWGPVRFSSPGHIGFWSEVARCRRWLINTNLTQFPGVPSGPKRQGKKAALKQAAKPHSSRQQVKDWHELLINLPDVLENTAAEMVSNRTRFGLFQNRDKIKALLTEISELKARKVAEVDRSDDFQFAWVEDDGRVFFTGKGFNIPKTKKNKLQR